MRRTLSVFGILSTAVCVAPAFATGPADPRLREITYDRQTVVTVPVKRGVVTLIVLDSDESILEVASGLGADCTKVEAAWCVAAQPGGRDLFVKPKSSASDANTLAVVTDRRVHSFRFVVLADSDPRPPLYRLLIRAPARPQSSPPVPPHLNIQEVTALTALPAISITPPPQQLVAERMQARPEIRNTRYSIAEGKASQDIVPTLIFDDGRFTYLRFPGNRDLPSVFHVLGDGSETLVNVRMEDDLMVVDRVSPRLMLRAGAAVVGIWNDAFDIDGQKAENGTTVPGVRRTLRANSTTEPSVLTQDGGSP